MVLLRGGVHHKRLSQVRRAFSAGDSTVSEMSAKYLSLYHISFCFLTSLIFSRFSQRQVCLHRHCQYLHYHLLLLSSMQIVHWNIRPWKPKDQTHTLFWKECIVVSNVEQSLDPAKHFPGHIFRTHVSLNFNAHNILLHLIHRLTKVVHSLKETSIGSKITNEIEWEQTICTMIMIKHLEHIHHPLIPTMASPYPRLHCLSIVHLQHLFNGHQTPKTFHCVWISAVFEGRK